MKAISISVVLLAMVFVGSFISYNYLSYSSNEIDKTLSNLNIAVEKERWNEAENLLSQVDNKWNGVNNLWAALLDHQEIDNIEIEMAKMEKYIATKNLTNSLAEISAVRLLFDHIPEKEKLSFKNVF